MKCQLFFKTTMVLVCSLFVVSSYAQNDDPPTLPNDPEGITDYLPLTLVNFSAALQSGSVLLSWKTTNEVNVSNFRVEKSSDGINFHSIATVNAYNNLVNNYSLNDNGAIENVAYYRLKMIDKDGTYQYSFIILLKNKTSNSLFIYPNPATNFVTIVHGLSKGKATLSITNIAGVTLQTLSVNNNVQQTSFTLGSSLKPGNYLLKYTDDNGTKTLFFIKQ